MRVKTIIKAFVISGISLTLPAAFAQTTLLKEVNTSSLFGNNYTVMNQMAIAEGDILIGDPDSLSYQQRGMGLSEGSGLWDNGLVPYELADDLSEDVLRHIHQAIDHWNLASSIRLVERSTLGQDQATDYIEFVNGPACASWVGKQGGKQALWVASQCTAGSVIHEIGHALGLLHEHTRADRDLYIEVNRDNIAKGKEHNFNIVESSTRELGPYDYGSIMHYGEYFFSNNGKQTLVPIGSPAGTVVGQRVTASEGDLAAIDRLYGTSVLNNDGPHAANPGGGGGAGIFLLVVMCLSALHKSQRTAPRCMMELTPVSA